MSDLHNLFPGSSEMSRLIREKDWAQSPLGESHTWPDSLLHAVNILLGSRYPMEIWWGPEYLRFYNDAYRPLLGPERHPHFLGRPGKECWAEIWDQIGPMLDEVMRTGNPTYSEDSLLLLTRKGFEEETYVTWSYGPIRSRDGKVEGIFCACDETTKKVLSRRRLATLSKLGLNAKASPQALDEPLQVLAQNPRDIPFALVYQFEPDGRTATLIAQTSSSDTLLAPSIISLDEGSIPWPLGEARRTQEAVVVSRESSSLLSPQAMVFPIRIEESGPTAAVVLGVSSRLELDREYRDFLWLVARHIEATLEAESTRQRIEMERSRLKTAFMQSPAFMCIVLGPNHIFDFVNDQYCRLIGRRDILGKPVAEALPEVVSQGFLGILNSVYEKGETYIGKKTSLMLQKVPGDPLEEVILDFVYQPIKDQDGSCSGILVHGIDITEEMHGQQERENLFLSEKAARAEAERTSRMKDEFLATLSHELRTPLNAILGWSTILQKHPTQGKDLRTGLETIERNARAQTQIIEDLLDMSRIISGKVRLNVQHFDLQEVLSQSIETMQTAADAKGIPIHRTFEPFIEPVLGDPNRLRQVFCNLLNNAIKFTEKDGQLHVSLKQNGRHVEVGVADTGQGIPPDFLPHVFDRFQQADATNTRRYGGLGLGLAIVKQLIELHGGSVRAQSDGEGQGATFTVCLPLGGVLPQPEGQPHRQDVPQEEKRPAPPTNCLVGLRVLVIDDEADARTLARHVLEQSGASVITSSSAKEALAFLQSSNFDVLVCDIGMPEQDGYSFIRNVRALSTPKRTIPAVALTAYARSEDSTKALSAGFQKHLAKPVDPGGLVTMVASLVRDSHNIKLS